MGRHDWYRRRTWTDADQTEFFARLKRSRGAFHKAQYLAIQAGALCCAGKKQLASEAIKLLDMALTDYPTESWQHASVFLTKANCLWRHKDHDAAIECMRRSLQAQRTRPNVMTTAWLEFGWYVVEAEMIDLYDEALGVLAEFGPKYEDFELPEQVYQKHTILALILQHQGELDAATQHAREALSAAAATHSGYSRHPDIGLVKSTKNTLHRRLLALADES